MTVRVTRTRRRVEPKGLSYLIPEILSPATDTLPRARVRSLLENCVGTDLDSWEKFTFLPSIVNRFVLTEKQEARLRAMEVRVLGEDYEWKGPK